MTRLSSVLLSKKKIRTLELMQKPNTLKPKGTNTNTHDITPYYCPQKGGFKIKNDDERPPPLHLAWRLINERVPGAGFEPTLSIRPGRWCRSPLDHESSALAKLCYPGPSNTNAVPKFK